MDAFGHVNNASYYRYYESVRISYLQAIGALDHLDVMNPVVAANSCCYLVSVSYPDELRLVHAWLSCVVQVLEWNMPSSVSSKNVW